MIYSILFIVLILVVLLLLARAVRDLTYHPRRRIPTRSRIIQVQAHEIATEVDLARAPVGVRDGSVAGVQAVVSDDGHTTDVDARRSEAQEDATTSVERQNAVNVN